MNQNENRDREANIEVLKYRAMTAEEETYIRKIYIKSALTGNMVFWVTFVIFSTAFLFMLLNITKIESDFRTFFSWIIFIAIICCFLILLLFNHLRSKNASKIERKVLRIEGKYRREEHRIQGQGSYYTHHLDNYNLILPKDWIDTGIFTKGDHYIAEVYPGPLSGSFETHDLTSLDYLILTINDKKSIVKRSIVKELKIQTDKKILSDSDKESPLDPSRSQWFVFSYIAFVSLILYSISLSYSKNNPVYLTQMVSQNYEYQNVESLLKSDLKKEQMVKMNDVYLIPKSYYSVYVVSDKKKFETSYQILRQKIRDIGIELIKYEKLSPFALMKSDTWKQFKVINEIDKDLFEKTKRSFRDLKGKYKELRRRKGGINAMMDMVIISKSLKAPYTIKIKNYVNNSLESFFRPNAKFGDVILKGFAPFKDSKTHPKLYNSDMIFLNFDGLLEKLDKYVKHATKGYNFSGIIHKIEMDATGKISNLEIDTEGSSEVSWKIFHMFLYVVLTIFLLFSIIRLIQYCGINLPWEHWLAH